MAAAAVARAAGSRIRVATAGTHVVEGQPAGSRTRAALSGLGLRVDGHRSRQLRAEDLAGADLVIGFSAEHVAYVRRRHPEAAARTGTLRLVCRELAAGPAPLAERVAGLHLGEVQLRASDDVADPAGGEEADFEECAREICRLCEELVRLVPPRGTAG
jgi:protein-tyrosine-phosphatase